MVGPAQILVGTDYPYMAPELPIERGRSAPSGLPQDIHADIAWNNCFRFLGIKPPAVSAGTWIIRRASAGGAPAHDGLQRARRSAGEIAMLEVTRDLMLPTAITGSYPRPLWYDASLRGRSFKTALGDSMFREQYFDAVAAVINAQEAAGLDIVTDGDSRFDLAVGGKSWFFYPIERLGGIEGHRDTSRGWMQRHGLRPGKILWEVQEAYQPGGGEGPADARPARIHRALEGGAAPHRQARQVRRDLRARPRQHAVGRALPATTRR